MRFFRLSYIAAGSIGTESAFFFDLPLGAAGCSWRTEPDGGVGAGPDGGGLAVRGGAVDVVAVVVMTVPFIEGACGRIGEEIGERVLDVEEPGLESCGVGSATRECPERAGKSDLTLPINCINCPLFLHRLSLTIQNILFMGSGSECKDRADAP